MFKQFLFILFLGSLIYNAEAQNPGCDGERFRGYIFDSVQLSSDVVYGNNVTIGGSETVLKMDIYEPFQDTLSIRPVVFIVHGGGFTSGSKSGYRFVKMAADYVKKGYVAVSIDYRLYDLKTPPDSFLLKDAIVRGMSDLKAAMRFLHEDATGINTYRADTNYYFLSGVSSGAIIANTTAYLDDINEADDQMRQLIYTHGGMQGNSSNNLQYKPKALAVLNASGGMLQYDYIDEEDPALLSIHCPADPTMPYKRDWIVVMGDTVVKMYGSFFLHNTALNHEIESELIQVPGAIHVQYFTDPIIYDSMINVSADMFVNIACADSGGSIPVTVPEYHSISSMIYPNPASQFVYFKNIENPHVSIYSSLGIRLKQYRIVGNRLDVSDLKEGLYFIITKNEGIPGRYKLIIAR